ARKNRPMQPSRAAPTSRRSRQPIQRDRLRSRTKLRSSSPESKADSGPPVYGGRVLCPARSRSGTSGDGRLEPVTAMALPSLPPPPRRGLASDQALLAGQHGGFGAAGHVQLLVDGLDV